MVVANQMQPPAKSVLITGASAGVGRAIAVAFAKKGWRVALLARSKDGLASARAEVEAVGGSAITHCVDVADSAALFAAADDVVAQWDGIDVWINNAMVTVFSEADDLSPAELARVTEVSYLGTAYGTMAALKHMRQRNVGTIVQVGSALSYRAIPLQSAYCGAKFAVRGFSNALRSELAHARSKVRLTMVQLPAVNTPQFDWARNKLGFRVQPVPPVYQPEAIAEAIYRAAIQAPRELWIGFPAVKAIVANMIAPGLLDSILARVGYRGQITSTPVAAGKEDNLFSSTAPDYSTRGRFDEISKATVRSYNPKLLRIAFAVVVLAVVASIIFAARS